MNRVQDLINKLKETFLDSKFDYIKNDWIDIIEKKHPNIPENLKQLYVKLGYGTIGDSYYSIHFLLEPDEIYDEITANELKGKYIVGDNFSGDCHAYDANNNWAFGYIDCNGEFNILPEYADFIEFLEELTSNKIQEDNT